MALVGECGIRVLWVPLCGLCVCLISCAREMYEWLGDVGRFFDLLERDSYH